MATDNERREAAERLRGARVYTLVGKGDDGITLEWHLALMSELAEAVGLRDTVGIEVFDRLADLIEPDCGTGEAPASRVDGRDGTRERLARALGIDLPALLALAEELDSWARDRGDGYEPVLWRAGCVAYARRIREACGEAVRADGL